MRIAVLILGILGVLGSLILGLNWLLAIKIGGMGISLLSMLGAGSVPSPKELEVLARVAQCSQAWPFLLAGAVLGVLGILLAYRGRRFSAAALFGCAALGPAVFTPDALLSTFGLVVAAALALFVEPPPADPAPAT